MTQSVLQLIQDNINIISKLITRIENLEERIIKLDFENLVSRIETLERKSEPNGKL